MEAPRSRFIWITASAMLLYSVVRYGLTANAESFAASIVGSAASYLIAIFLYFALARCASKGWLYPLWIAFVGSIVVSYLLVGRNDIWSLMTDWSIVFAGGMAPGRMAYYRASRSTTYLYGLSFVVVLSVIWLLPRWTEIAELAIAGPEAILKWLQTSLGGAASIAGPFQGSLERLLGIIVRVLPAMLVMSAVAQYSIGWGLFVNFSEKREGEESLLKQFRYLKMPRVLLVFLLSAIVARMFDSFTVKLIADNLLMALSVFYCVAGLALIGFYLEKFRVSIWLKLIFYLILLPTGLVGYLTVSLFGVAVSAYDFRRLGQPNNLARVI